MGCASAGGPDTCVCCRPRAGDGDQDPGRAAGRGASWRRSRLSPGSFPPLKAFFLKYSNYFRHGAGEGKAEIPSGDERAADNEAAESPARPPLRGPAGPGTAQYGTAVPLAWCPMSLPRPCRAQPQVRHPNPLGFVPSLCCIPREPGGRGGLWLPPAFDPANKAPDSSQNPCAVSRAAASLPGSPRSRAGPEDPVVLRRSWAACPLQGGRDVLALGTLLAVPGVGDRSVTIAPCLPAGPGMGWGYGSPQGLELEGPMCGVPKCQAVPPSTQKESASGIPKTPGWGTPGSLG